MCKKKKKLTSPGFQGSGKSSTTLLVVFPDLALLTSGAGDLAGGPAPLHCRVFSDPLDASHTTSKIVTTIKVPEISKYSRGKVIASETPCRRESLLLMRIAAETAEGKFLSHMPQGADDLVQTLDFGWT